MTEGRQSKRKGQASLSARYCFIYLPSDFGRGSEIGSLRGDDGGSNSNSSARWLGSTPRIRSICTAASEGACTSPSS